MAAKRLGLLLELVPAAARVALLIDPATMDSILEDAKTAARTMGLQIQVVHASTSRDIEAAFASFGRERPDALLVGARVGCRIIGRNATPDVSWRQSAWDFCSNWYPQPPAKALGLTVPPTLLARADEVIE